MKALLCAIMVVLSFAAEISDAPKAVDCYYYACDPNLDKCSKIDPNDEYLIKVKTCPANTKCVMENTTPACKPVVSPVSCIKPGYRKIKGRSCCVATPDKDAYCAGVGAGKACSLSDDKLCNPGLFCDSTSKVCQAYLAKGAACSVGKTPCQPSEFCHAAGKCVPLFSIVADQEATNENQCESHFLAEGKCRALPKIVDNTYWFDVGTAISDLCVYELKLSSGEAYKENGKCTPGSRDSSKAVMCNNFQSANYAAFNTYIKNMKDNSCMSGDYLCDAAIDAFGCAKVKEAYNATLFNSYEIEKNNVDCVEKNTKVVLESLFRCASEKLAIGVVSALTISLLVLVL